MPRLTVLLLLAWIAAPALAQTAPAPPPATRPPPIPNNLERTLDASVTVDAEQKTLADLIASLQKTTNTNIVPNWNALAQSGITRDTIVTLHLKDLPYEHVIKTLVEVIPTKPAGIDAPLAPMQVTPGLGLRPNYQVGENTLELTTNANIGRAVIPRLYPMGKLLTAALPGESPSDNTRLLEQIFHAELARSDEPIDAKGRALAIKSDTLAASISDRGHTAIARVQMLLATPIKPGQLAVGVMVTGSAKRTQDALAKQFNTYKDGALPPAVAEAIARDPQKYAASFNTALLPGTADELARDKPALSGTITDGGVVLIGPLAALQSRTLFSVYDLRDIIRKQQAKTRPAPAAVEVQITLLQTLSTKITPLSAAWSDPAKPHPVSFMIPYHGALVVIAPADTHRQLTLALQELNR